MPTSCSWSRRRAGRSARPIRNRRRAIRRSKASSSVRASRLLSCAVRWSARTATYSARRAANTCTGRRAEHALDRRLRGPCRAAYRELLVWGKALLLRGGDAVREIRDGLIGSIGNTPLIRLRGPSELTGCEILGKAEFLNPGGSVKDRAGLYLILDAEKRGLLKPGGLIVEGTAGNTGIGLALVGNARGYRTLIVIPDTQSQEKKDMLRLCGAELREV